jgi:hypothetical protein
VGLLVPAAGTAQTSGNVAINKLNVQRAANEIGPVTQHPDLSNGCVNHLNYMQLNQDAAFDSEVPGNPGYTPIGAEDPESSVVYQQGIIRLFATYTTGVFDFASNSNPWQEGPGHQAAMFDPTYTWAGYGAITHGTITEHCMRLAGFTSENRTTLAAFTGIRGRENVPYAMRICCEGPASPQQAAGLGKKRTGPVIVLYAYRPDRKPLRMTNFSLFQGTNKVPDVRFLQGTTNATIVSGAMHGPASAMIPAAPLLRNTDYRAVINWTRGELTFKQVVRFTTGTASIG